MGYEILLMVLFLLFFLFLASEALLFISFFWASFHSLSSHTLGIWPGEGFYLPDPCELTFANTLLLSNAAVSLGGAFVSLEISCSFLIFFSLFSFILAWTFISLQIIEFRIMGLSINDSFYSCVFFFLTGLHFFHLVLGLLRGYSVYGLCLTFWTNEFLGSYCNYKFIISFSIFNRMGFWRILCSQSNIEEVFYLSFSTPISSLWFWNSSSFLSSFSIF